MSHPAAAYHQPTTRVVWICHLVRWASLAWIAWGLVVVVIHWTDRNHLVTAYGPYIGADLSDLTYTAQMLALAIALLDWAASAVVVYLLWRLFGRYLRGNIFTIESVDDMRRLGWAGVAAVAADVVARPLIFKALTLHLSNAPAFGGFGGQPNDLLHLMMAAFVLALACVFRTGVDIAEDNRQIV